MYFSALYASCLFGNLVEQLWNFAWLSVIAMIHPSLLLVAIMGFFTKLAIIIGGPLVGKFLDYFPRVPAYNCLNVVQPWFVALILAGAVERLSGVALGVAMEHDCSWTYIAGASLFGIRLSKYGPVTCLKFAAGLMALVLIYIHHRELHWTMCNYECYSYICVCNPDQATWHFKGRRAWIDIGSLSHHSPLLFFLCMIVSIYLVFLLLILQTGIPSSKANLIGTTEVAVASLAESTMLGVAIIANDVSHFRYLAMLSLLSIVGSAF
ncbi:hypothetical protein G4B88_005476, partial [Cannabis sativa]